MKNCANLKSATQLLIPDYFDSVDWGNIWNRKLESGSGFEWATLAAIMWAAKEKGYSVFVPLLEHFDAGNYYLLRNEIPLTHGAQAGNADSELKRKPLNYRFLYSLVPKAIIKKGDSCYSIFREGCPYHKIMGGLSYLERTDIIIVPGTIADGYPKLSETGRNVLFAYNYDNIELSGTLDVKSSVFIPVKKRNPKGGIKIIAQGIVECSVNKSEEVANEQLSRYKTLFGSNNGFPKFSLITGNDLSSLDYDTHTIDLKTEDYLFIAAELKSAATGILDEFCL